MAYTTPRTWVAGETVTAALLNTHLRDNFKSIGDPWTSYSPTWSASTTPPTLGTSTVTGAYIATGKFINGWIKVTVGSGFSAGSGSYTWTLPVTAGGTLNLAVGSGVVFDNSASTTYGLLAMLHTSTTIGLVQGGSGGGRYTNAAPMITAANDQVTIAFSYEAA